MKRVYVYAAESPVLKSGILDEDRKLKVKFYVPEASEAAYTSAEVWKEYVIFPMSELEMFKVTVSSNDAATATPTTLAPSQSTKTSPSLPSLPKTMSQPLTIRLKTPLLL